jgi:F0F1-type ATP synthase delta subunit
MKAQRSKIAGTIAGTTLKKGMSKKYAREVAAYLLENRRTGDLDSILRDVQADWASAGYLEVIAASAHPLTAALRADITRRVKALYPSAKKISISEEHDPEIIGGVSLSLPGRQLDLSVEAKLNRFKQLTSAGKD